MQQIANRVGSEIEEPVALFPDWHYEDDNYFAFNYNSQRFIDSREPRDALVGHGPVVVEKATGRVLETGSAFRLEENLESLRQTGELKPIHPADVEVADWTSELCATWLNELGDSGASRLLAEIGRRLGGKFEFGGNVVEATVDLEHHSVQLDSVLDDESELLPLEDVLDKLRKLAQPEVPVTAELGDDHSDDLENALAVAPEMAASDGTLPDEWIRLVRGWGWGAVVGGVMGEVVSWDNRDGWDEGEATAAWIQDQLVVVVGSLISFNGRKWFFRLEFPPHPARPELCLAERTGPHRRAMMQYTDARQVESWPIRAEVDL